MKRKIALLLSLLAAVAFCFGLAACKQKGILLKDFPEAETQTVALGSVYELKTQAEGEDGNTYRLNYKVRTGDDASVPVFDDRFDVTDIGGYVITYTAVTDGVTQTSVVTLEVTDDTAPTISISKPENGSAGEEYELPVITVSDLAGTSPEVTVRVYLIREGERTEIASLSERDGRYYFTPESVGTYEIEVTAVKSNGQSKTATRSFNVDEPVAEGEVFSPAVVSPESQIGFVAAGSVETNKLIVETAEETQEGAAYSGSYLSVNGKDVGENVWVDIHLTPRLAVEDYADFDVVEFWVYFQTTSDRVKIGILGGSTAASDPLLREFAGNTWAKLSVDAGTFFDLIGSKRLFTVNFNNPASGNHAGVTEVRIGSVTAKYAFAPAVTVDATAAETDEKSEVTLTVDTDAAFAARIEDRAGNEVPCTVEGNVVRASLPMGTYTYTLTAEDSSYIGSFNGMFTVEGTTQIVLPEAESGVAGEEYTIPDALVSVRGELQEGIRAECEATFVQGLNGKASETVSGSFTPLTFGTLTLSYTYEGAAPKTMTVEIAPAQAEGSVLFDPSTATGSNIDSNRSEQKFTARPGDPSAEYTGSYLELTAEGYTEWANTRLKLDLNKDSYKEYEKIGVWVYFEAKGTVTHSLFNDNAYKTQYAANRWHLILVDREAFIEKITAAPDLLAIRFHTPGNGNFPDLTAARLGAIVAVNALEEAVVEVDGTVDYGETTKVTITVNGNASDLTAFIRNGSGRLYPCSVNGNVITADLPIGVYRYEITSSDPAYAGTLEGSFSVENRTQIVVKTGSNYVAGQPCTVPGAYVTVDGEKLPGISPRRDAYFVSDLNGSSPQSVNDTFTPLTSGTLTAEYSYNGAESRTISIRIRPAGASGNTVYSPAMWNDELTSQNGRLYRLEAKMSDDPVYSGSYFAVTLPSKTGWEDMYLALGLSADAYSDHDKIGIWVYAAAEGNVNLTPFNNAELKATYTPNEWHLIVIDRDVFMEHMSGSGPKRLFPLQFGEAGAVNFPNMTEFRLGEIVALHSFDEAEVSVRGTVDLGENAGVTFTIGEEASDITVKITDEQGGTTSHSAANGTLTLQLPAGIYTYEITTADPAYTGKIEGTFAVESKVQIILPEAEDGVAGEEYIIPEASVTVDGETQTEKATFTATFVQSLNGKAEEVISQSTFTPITAGTLTIVYSYEGAVPKTLTVEIAPAKPKDNVIFDASTATADNFTSTNGSLHTAVADPKGNYISIQPASGANVWSDLKLYIDDVSAFAEYDVISFRVYFVTTSKTVKIGILGGSTGDTDPLLRTFPGNTWANVTVDAKTFFNLIGSKTLFPVNFNNPSSGNHAGVTEVRLGAIVALYELDDATVPEGLYAAEGGTTRIEIIVNEDATNISAVIKDANQIEQTCTVSGSTIAADLPVGVYTFEITTSDPRYTGKITGSFTVESSIQIVTPILPTNGTALEEFTIPHAQIKENGEPTDNTANCTAVFKPTYGTETEVSSTFTPSSSGTLTITYTYEGALKKVFTVTIGRAEKPEEVLLDLRNNDVLADVSTYITDAGKSTKVSYNEEGKYLVWTDVNSSSSGAWPTLGVNFQTTQQALKNAGVAYLKLDVYYQTTGSADPTGFFCNQKFQIGSTSVKTGADNIPRNSWYTVYIPVEYLTDEVLRGQHSLIQTKFGTAGNWNFDNVQEVRLKGFVPVTENEIPDGMFVDMGSLGADSVADVFGSDYGTQLSYVAATDSERAYLSWTAGENTLTTNWCNLKVKPLASFNAHDLYDYIAVELYYVGEADKTISWFFLDGGCTANTGSGNRLTTNEWITVYLPIEKYFGTPSGGSGYFMECMFDNAGHAHFPGISEVRIGNIFFTNTAGSSETDYVFTLN